MSSRKEQKEQLRIERERAEREAAASASRGRRMKIIGAVVGGAAIVVIAAVLISLGGGNSNKVNGADEVEARFKGIPQNGIILGDPKAPVTLVEYADLKCPFCADFATHVLPTLIDDYVRDGKLKIEFRNLTFVGEGAAPGDSRDAATFAAAAGLQNKLWNFVDLFYINQKDELERYATDAWLKKLGGAIPGLNVEQAMSKRTDKKVDGQLAEAERRFTEAGFTGTPAFQIHKTGEPPAELTYGSVEKPDDFKSAIDALLE